VPLPPSCPARFPGPVVIGCQLDAGHPGPHTSTVQWDAPGVAWRNDDDAPTAKLPPITETVRRRPPVPHVRELKGAELLRALAAELEDLDDDE
jgi:hypothetical protein